MKNRNGKLSKEELLDWAESWFQVADRWTNFANHERAQKAEKYAFKLILEACGV